LESIRGNRSGSALWPGTYPELVHVSHDDWLQGLKRISEARRRNACHWFFLTRESTIQR
jgi:hypothetical protein